MKVAYVDTSCLVAVAFDEPGAEAMARRLEGYAELVSTNLLEAEFRSALAREQVAGGEDFLAAITWLLPDRRLEPEILRVLAVGRLRGADLWHLAAALYLAETPSDIDFITLDREQGEAARALGFGTPG